jgi:hypothetical protein
MGHKEEKSPLSSELSSDNRAYQNRITDNLKQLEDRVS